MTTTASEPLEVVLTDQIQNARKRGLVGVAGSCELELEPESRSRAWPVELNICNEIGMHRVAFSVDDIDEALEIAARHGCRPLRGVATYGTCTSSPMSWPSGIGPAASS